jgi:hypothetical protein
MLQLDVGSDSESGAASQVSIRLTSFATGKYFGQIFNLKFRTNFNLKFWTNFQPQI